MSKFNTKKSPRKPDTTNYMEGAAFTQSAKEELTFAVMTTFLADSYYESSDTRLDRIKQLVADVAKSDPQYIANLAVYVRKECHMRSASHVLIGELARVHRGTSIVKDAIANGGVERLDDAAEIISYLKKPIPNAVKKGIAVVLKKFDKYALAKYKMEGKDVSLVDIFNLVHPVPKDAQQARDWKALMSGNLKSFDTWESVLSAEGNNAKAWHKLFDSGRLGYMALLRNLRNILQTGDHDLVMKAVTLIEHPDEVRKSKQLPFRFLSAISAIDELRSGDSSITFSKEGNNNVKRVREALETALMHSISNIPTLPGRTAILTDNSGSMGGDYGGSSALSALGTTKTVDIANLFAALYSQKADNTYIGAFGDRLINVPVTKGVFKQYCDIRDKAAGCGGSTEAGLFEFLRTAIRTKLQMDRIVIFSDCQVGEGCKWYGNGTTEHASDANALLKRYLGLFPKCRIYSVDLRGYGNAMVDKNVVKICGWSNKIFELMDIVEKGSDGIVKVIEDYSYMSKSSEKPVQVSPKRSRKVKTGTK